VSRSDWRIVVSRGVSNAARVWFNNSPANKKQKILGLCLQIAREAGDEMASYPPPACSLSREMR
jgi:hypothetical protein